MRRFLGLAAVALLCAGCAAVRRPSPVGPSPLPSAAELQGMLAARRAAVQSLRGFAHIRYEGPDQSANSRDAVVLARPDRLRVEVLSMFGPLFVFTTTSGELAAYERQENTLYRGRTSPENLWRYARLALPVADLVDVVLGTPPPRATHGTDVSFDTPHHAIRLWQALDRGAQVVWFSPAAQPLAAEERDASGTTQWRATFSDYRPFAGYPIATHISIELPGSGRAMTITLDDIDVNPAVDQSVFALQTPPGTRVVDLDRFAD